jgi:hypothetical protein
MEHIRHGDELSQGYFCMKCGQSVSIMGHLMCNTLLRIGNEMVRIGLPFNKKSLKDFAYQDLLFINSYVKLVETKRNSAELIL